MMYQLVNDIKRHRADIRSNQRRLHYMQRMAHRRHQNFRLAVLIAVDTNDLLDQIHTIFGNVIQPPDKR